MKKIYIQFALFGFAILFVWALFLYFLQSNKIKQDRLSVIIQENVSESSSLLEQSEKTSRLDDEIVKEVVLENNTSQENKEIVKPEIIQQEESSIVENDQQKINITQPGTIPEINKSLNISWTSSAYDLYRDDSYEKFVGSKVPFFDLQYIPDDLVSFSSLYVTDTKWNWELRREAASELEKLSKSFYDEFWENIVVVSSYRSYLYQKWIKDRGCPDNLCAKAGYSEHQWWLAIDLWEATNNSEFLGKQHLKNYYEWLIKNAASFWYHNSYQKGLAIDGYDKEPWHWRYVWEELAIYLMKNNLTHTEFYNLQSWDE